MKMRFCAIVLYAFLLNPIWAIPSVTNVTAAQRAGTKWVDVYYSISGSGPFNVNLEVSPNNGASFPILAVSVTGDAGSGISAGNNKHVVWDAGADWDGKYTPECRVRIIASDGASQTVPTGMEYVPAGSIAGGSCSAFLLDRYEVTKNLWDTVIAWSQSQGYIIGGGAASEATHPVVNVSWYDCVKWCNARSEREGLTPCYYTDATHTTVYRTGNLNLLNDWVDWTADGYRLPTELEWHWAASGGLNFIHPWGDTISPSDANYNGSGDPFESATIGTTPVGYYNGGQTPTGPDRGNGFGLYDMAGNVTEFCWDATNSSESGAYPSSATNPRGVDFSSGYNYYRIIRGGAWSQSPTSASGYFEIATRNSQLPSALTYKTTGFRSARGL